MFVKLDFDSLPEGLGEALSAILERAYRRRRPNPMRRKFLVAYRTAYPNTPFEENHIDMETIAHAVLRVDPSIQSTGNESDVVMNYFLKQARKNLSKATIMVSSYEALKAYTPELSQAVAQELMAKPEFAEFLRTQAKQGTLDAMAEIRANVWFRRFGRWLKKHWDTFWFAALHTEEITLDIVEQLQPIMYELTSKKAIDKAIAQVIDNGARAHGRTYKWGYYAGMYGAPILSWAVLLTTLGAILWTLNSVRLAFGLLASFGALVAMGVLVVIVVNAFIPGFAVALVYLAVGLVATNVVIPVMVFFHGVTHWETCQNCPGRTLLAEHHVDLGIRFGRWLSTDNAFYLRILRWVANLIDHGITAYKNRTWHPIDRVRSTLSKHTADSTSEKTKE